MEPKVRCVNIDWLEVYCLEDLNRWPCDANYFRRCGYFVDERPYGTRQYNQMFTIEDVHGDPWIEIRRDPPSGDSKFSGLDPNSCHIRLVNRTCYYDDCVSQLRDFLAKHDYVFKRIFRIDICYDFEYFDSGDRPDRFARRLVERKFRKVNQCHLAAHSEDTWADYEWQSFNWGNPKSMVSTKFYNKSLELSCLKKDKPYIRYCWWLCGLVDDPINQTRKMADGSEYKPEIWRVEFSLKSQARNWIVIESQEGKRQKQKRIPHTLELFDTKAKLWDRFEELAYHYFRFKYREYKNVEQFILQPKVMKGKKKVDLQLKRKDLCQDKQLFKFNMNREFYKVQQLPKASTPDNADRILRNRLQLYKLTHFEQDVQQACDVLLNNLTRSEVRRLTQANDREEVEILQRVIALKLKYPEEDVMVLVAKIRKLLSDDAIF